MAHFEYTGVNKKKSQVKGSVDASNHTEAMRLLVRQGIQVTTLKEASGKKINKNLFGSGKVKTEDLVIFTRQLATMVNAGVPLTRSLSTLQGQAKSPILADALDQVSRDVQGGISLGDSFSKFPKIFSDIYVNMVRAGEAGGILDDILKRLAFQTEKSASVQKKIKGAMAYPVVLLVITVVAFFGLMLFVIPQIGEILKNLGGDDVELPMLTGVMLNISKFMVANWVVMFAIIGIAVFFTLRYIRTPSGKYNFHKFLLNVPIIKGIIMKLAVARFSRTFSSVLGAGVSILESIHVTGNAVGNEVYKKELYDAAEQVKNGKQLSEVLKTSKYYPPIVAEMLAVGEETGQIDTILVKIADFYEEEVDTMIESLSSILQPVMIIAMGSVVGLIAASVMGPIADMANNIQ